MLNFQFELENRVLGLRKWSGRKKTAFFLNFQNFQFLADFDHFGPSFDLETHSTDLKIRKKSRIRHVRFLVKTGSEVVKIW